jgi:hypothetical protein
VLIDVYNVLLVNISGQKNHQNHRHYPFKLKGHKDAYLERIVHSKNVKFVIQILWMQLFLYQQKNFPNGKYFSVVI